MLRKLNSAKIIEVIEMMLLTVNVLALAPVTEWESPSIILLKLLTVFALVLLNAFFVASEFAIVKVRGTQLEALDAADHPRVKFARHVASHLDAYLSATQLGITLASLGLGWLGEPFIAEMIEPFFALAGVTSAAVVHGFSFALAFAAITFLHIVIGELAPKSLAIRKSVPTTLWVAAPLGLFYTVFKPAIWLLNGAANFILRHLFRLDPVAESERVHSEEELRVILSESQKTLEVSPLQKTILLHVLKLQDLTVRDVMTPRGSVVFLDTEDPLAENLRRAKASRHSRFPLCRSSLDEPVGLIHIKDLLTIEGETTPELMSLKRELLVVPEMMELPRLFKRLLAKNAHMAVAVDEFGGTSGVVTLENVVEQLVGEIQDEFDAEEPLVRRISDTEFFVDGAVPLHKLSDLTGVEFAHEDVSTAGGYVTAILGRFPRKDEEVTLHGYRVTVTQSDDRRVVQLHFHKLCDPKLSEARQI